MEKKLTGKFQSSDLIGLWTQNLSQLAFKKDLINKTECNSDQCDLKDAMKRLMSGGMFLQEVADLDLGGPMPESLF